MMKCRKRLTAYAFRRVQISN